MHGPAAHKVYLQPLAILGGRAASEAVAVGHARWLAGGPMAFTMVKIIFREGAVRMKEDIYPVADLDHYVNMVPLTQQEAIRERLAHISMTRSFLGRNFKEGCGPLLQGIVNVTPDSFSDGGRYGQCDRAVAHARDLIAAGADIIDIGGESTRPGAENVAIEEELSRVIPVIEGLSDITQPISIDARKTEVMARALKAGASIINDVSALSHDEKSMDFVASTECPVILMHAQNNPDNMQDDPCYDDVLLDVYDYLESRTEICQAVGIGRDRIIIDPGIGFGKTLEHNKILMANLSLFHGLGLPILLGVSRKSFIGHITGETEPAGRLAGSLAFAQMGYDQGVQILRVHDVRESHQARAAWISLGG